MIRELPRGAPVLESETKMVRGVEIKLPAEIAQTLQENTRRYLDSIFDIDPQTDKPTKKPTAPSIVAVMERSGAIAASGITDFFHRHRITDPRLIILSHLGHELEESCGYILHPDVPDMTDQEFVDGFITNLQTLASGDSHPVSHQVQKLAQVITQLPSGDHEIQMIDDYMAQGGVNEVIMPTILELAGKQAGLTDQHLNIAHPTVDQLIQRHIIEEEPHQNRFDRSDRFTSASSTKTIHFSPDRSIAMLPNTPHWLDQIVEESFGPNLTLTQAGFLNEALRGQTDFDNPELATPAGMAFSRGISARGFNGQTDLPPFRSHPQQEVTQLLTLRGLPEHEVDRYVAGLRTRLTDQILQLTSH